MADWLHLVWAFWKRDAQLALSYRIAFSMGVLGSIVRVVVLWLPAQLLGASQIFSMHGGFLPYSLIGMAMMGFLMSIYGSFAASVRSEQGMGTLEALLMTPASIAVLVLGSSLWTLTYALVDAALMLVAGAVIFGIRLQGHPAAALLVVFLTSLTFASAGILSAAFVVVFKRGDPFRLFVSGASFLLGGVVYPVEILPRWIEVLSSLLPITHGSRAVRGILLQGEALGKFSFEIGVLTVYSLVGIPLSIACFAWAIRRAQRDGTLLHF